jgi:chromosome partitioning protein
MKTRVVAVGNQKGGVGKTTTVINLAACLGEAGKSVLVVDLDPQCNATSGLGLSPSEGASVYHALLGDGHAGSLTQTSAIDNVDVLPAELDLAGAEVDVARMDGYLHCFSRAIAPVSAANRYDFILIDCPPSLGILTMNALAAADSLLVPMQCEYYALEGLSVISRLVQQLREGQANPRLEIEGILMTMYDGRTNLSTDVIREVGRHFPDKVYSTVIPRNVRLSEAPSFGRPITAYAPHSSGAEAYRRFANEFLARSQQKRMEPPAAAPVSTESGSDVEIQIQRLKEKSQRIRMFTIRVRE